MAVKMPNLRPIAVASANVPLRRGLPLRTPSSRPSGARRRFRPGDPCRIAAVDSKRRRLEMPGKSRSRWSVTPQRSRAFTETVQPGERRSSRALLGL